MLQTALVNPGGVFVRPPYDQEKWVAALDYRHRPVASSLALIRAIQAHITQLLLHAREPESWDHFIVRKFSANVEDEGVV